jgi:TIR domain
MPPVKIFIAHAPEDEKLKENLEEHLTMLKRNGYIDAWDNGRIIVGNEWAVTQNETMLSSHIILPLISSDFLASDETFSKTLEKAIELHHAGRLKVIPIILRDCLWNEGALAGLQPINGVSITSSSWDSPDTAMKKVAEEIKRISISIKEKDGKPFIPETPRVSQVGQLEQHKAYSRRWLYGGIVIVLTLLLMGIKINL